MMISFVDALLRLCTALLLGLIVGFERESDEQSAGLRTNALVSLGCALFTIISAYGFLGFTNLSHVQIDPTRIASFVTILVLIVLSILRFAIRPFLNGKIERQRLEIEFLPTTAEQFISMLYDLCERHTVKIVDLKVHIKDDSNKIVLTCDASKEANIFPVIEALRTYKGVVMVDVALKGTP